MLASTTRGAVQILLAGALAWVWAGTAEARPQRSWRAELGLKMLSTAIVRYQADHRGELPPNEGWFDALGMDEANAYDPWHSRYIYCRTADDRYALISVGPDGVFGTSDDQAHGDVERVARCRDRVAVLSWWDRMRRAWRLWLDDSL